MFQANVFIVLKFTDKSILPSLPKQVGFVSEEVSIIAGASVIVVVATAIQPFAKVAVMLYAPIARFGIIGVVPFPLVAPLAQL